MKRLVAPEILDGLSTEDPEAIRSRRDLRMINALMGNYRWIQKALVRFPNRPVVELGAGDGGLLRLLSRPQGTEERRLIGMDLVARPEGLESSIEWMESDVFDALGSPDFRLEGGVVVANLFLHHFERGRLRELGAKIGKGTTALCVSEPLRSRLALMEGCLLFPLVNRITRHDMMVSIRAGFRPGELQGLLGLQEEHWVVEEQCSLLGAYRLLAWRR